MYFSANEYPTAETGRKSEGDLPVAAFVDNEDAVHAPDALTEAPNAQVVATQPQPVVYYNNTTVQLGNTNNARKIPAKNRYQKPVDIGQVLKVEGQQVENNDFGSCYSRCSCCCLIFFLMIWGFLGMMVVGAIELPNTEIFSDEESRALGFLCSGAIFGGIFYLINFFTSLCGAKEFQSKHWYSLEEAQQILNHIHEKEPELSEYVECYHRERRGSNTVNVYTYKDTRKIQTGPSYDVSPKVKIVEGGRGNKKILKLYVRKNFTELDEVTRQNLLAQVDSFIAENIHRDLYMNAMEKYNVPDVPDVMIVNRYSGATKRRPLCYNGCLNFFCTLAALNIPYLLFMNFCCLKEKVLVNLKLLASDRDDYLERELPMRRINYVEEV